MKVIYFDLDEMVTINEPITACIGYFDGLHKGHQKLIEKVLEIAKDTGSKPALITFEPDPWTLLKNLTNLPHLTPMKHRMEIGEQMGLAYWIILKFKPEMANLSYDAFHTEVLAKLHLKTLVCGYDFHYAHFGRGDTTTLKEQTFFQVAVIDEVASEHKKISSTRIENLIKEGDVEKAAMFMGRWYELRGSVKSGSKVGREKGYPTANLKLDDTYIIPHNGVYIGSVFVKGAWHKAIINIGHNPTYNYQENTSIEAHLLDFDAIIYDEQIRFRFLQFLRNEHKFPNTEALIQQLKRDEEAAQNYFENRKEDVLCD